MIEGVVVVARSSETLTRTGSPIVAEVRGVVRLTRVLGDLWLQGFRWLQGVERLLRVLGDLFLQGLWWLGGVERLIRVLGDLL